MLVKHSTAVLALLNTSIGKDIQFENVDISNNCTKVIVGVGQWDAGWTGGKPTSCVDYQEALNTAISLMMRLFPPDIHIFYYSLQGVCHARGSKSVLLFLCVIF